MEKRELQCLVTLAAAAARCRGGGWGWRLRVERRCAGAAQGQWPRGATQRPRPGAAARRTYPTPEARGGGQEEQPHLQGAVAARAQKGLEELFHVQGQKGRG